MVWIRLCVSCIVFLSVSGGIAYGLVRLAGHTRCLGNPEVLLAISFVIGLMFCIALVRNGSVSLSPGASAVSIVGTGYIYNMVIKVDNVPLAERILREVFKITRFEVVSGDTIHLYEQLDQKARIVKAFAIKEIGVEEITVKGEDLEQYYMALIGKKK